MKTRFFQIKRGGLLLAVEKDPGQQGSRFVAPFLYTLEFSGWKKLQLMRNVRTLTELRSFLPIQLAAVDWAPKERDVQEYAITEIGSLEEYLMYVGINKETGEEHLSVTPLSLLKFSDVNPIQALLATEEMERRFFNCDKKTKWFLRELEKNSR